MYTLENFLSPLCMAIRHKAYKSKQAAFDAYIDSILIAKENYSWDQIADYLNTNTNSNIGSMSYRHMLTRAKSKRNKAKIDKTEKSNSPMHEQEEPNVVSKFFSSREDTTVKHDSTASMDKFKDKYL